MNRKIRKLLAATAGLCTLAGLGSIGMGAASAAPTPPPGHSVNCVIAPTPEVPAEGTLTVTVEGRTFVLPSMNDVTSGKEIIPSQPNGFTGPGVRVISYNDPSIMPGDTLQAMLGADPCGASVTLPKAAPVMVPPSITQIITPASTCAAPGGTGVASLAIVNPNGMAVTYSVLVNGTEVQTVMVPPGDKGVVINVMVPAGTYHVRLRAAGMTTDPVTFVVEPCATASPTPTPTETAPPTPIPTETATAPPTETAPPTQTASPTPTTSPSPTATATATASPTMTASPTPTQTGQPTPTETATTSPTPTASSHPTATASPSPSQSASQSPRPRPTSSSTTPSASQAPPSAKPGGGSSSTASASAGATVNQHINVVVPPPPASTTTKAGPGQLGGHIDTAAQQPATAVSPLTMVGGALLVLAFVLGCLLVLDVRRSRTRGAHR